MSENSQNLTLTQNENQLDQDISRLDGQLDIEERRTPWALIIPKKRRLGVDEVRSQESLPSTFDIFEESFSIGRGPEADWVLSNQFIHEMVFDRISKIHCRITKDCSNWENPIILEDLSRNGTFVNGQLVGYKRKRILKSNDVISFNEPMYKFFQFVNCYREECNDDLTENYYIGKQLGSGGQGTVRFVIDRKTCKKYAMKIVKRNLCGNLTEEKIMREVVIMDRLAHSNIIRCHNTIVKDNYIYMFLDYMEGGDLLKRIRAEDKLSVETAKHFFRQMCAAVKYLHDQNIIHRDIKPDNILLKSNDKFTELKVSDFGVSKLFSQDNSELHTICGTPLYVAPEISLNNGKLTGTYTNKIDIWGLGLVLYTMFCPFLEIANLNSGNLNFEHTSFRNVPPSAKDLIKKMLSVNSNDRPSIDEVLVHPWLKEDNENIDELNAMFEEKIREPQMKKPRMETSEMDESTLNEKCCIM